MNQQWNDVDKYLAATVVRPDAAVTEAAQATADAGMPAIEVTAAQGKLLMLLAQISGARRVLEIGTLGGFSTIWLARGIPDDGAVISCEFEPRHAEVARENLEQAGVGHKVDIRVGPALQTLPALSDQPPFDLVFIDADKEHNPDYVDWAVRLGRPGSVLVLDNVVRGGSVLEAESASEDTRGTRAALDLLGSHPQLEATALQTVGPKGWDGFALAVVR